MLGMSFLDDHRVRLWTERFLDELTLPANLSKNEARQCERPGWTGLRMNARGRGIEETMLRRG